MNAESLTTREYNDVWRRGCEDAYAGRIPMVYRARDGHLVWDRSDGPDWCDETQWAAAYIAGYESGANE